MPTAFVLITTEIGSEVSVLESLRKLSGVKETHAVFGVYDLVALVTADSMAELKAMITWKIRRITKVRSTLTMIILEE